MSVAASPIPGIRKSWLGALASGERRAGVALAGVRPAPGVALAGVRPGPAQVRIERVADGYLVRGETAWVTGWV